MPTKRKRRESFGMIDKLPSGRYRARYTGPDGRRHGAPSTFDTMGDARAWLRAQAVQIQRGEWVSPDERERLQEAAVKRAAAERFDVYAATWIEHRTTSTGAPLRPKTRAGYTHQLSKGLAEFAADGLRDITPARVRAWHARRSAVAPTAAGAEARLLRAILNTAVHDEILTKNPVPTSLTRTSTGMKHRMPTPEEVAFFLDEIEPRFRLAIVLAAIGGLRLSEWRALRRRDLVLREDGRMTVRIERTAQWVNGYGWVVGKTKSEAGEGAVTLPSDATPYVEAHLAEHVSEFPASLLFASRKGEFLHDREWSRAWNRVRDAAGLRVPVTTVEIDESTGEEITRTRYRAVVREHDLRHYAGTTFTRSGATLADAMRFLRHSTPAAAMVYQHSEDDRVAELTARLEVPRAKSPSTATIGRTETAL